MHACLPYHHWLKDHIRRNGSVEIVSSGNSMFPLILHGSRCEFVPFEPERAGIGDILLFVTEQHRLVGHRLIGIARERNKTWYVCKGDANRSLDPPVQADRIIGRLVRIHRRGRTIRADAGFPRLWGAFVARVPSVGRLLQGWARRYGT
jgi:signal peptidase I